MSAQEIKNLLAQFGLTPNKALGQNFLCDGAAARDIALSGCIQGRGALEIGPGLGSLTKPLLELAGRVVAVEIDERMVTALKARFGANERLTLIHADFLKVPEDELLSALGDECAVLANLPYYITTPICMRLLSFTGLKISNMSLMLQKEAAERFFAKPSSKQYGPLTVLSRCYYEVEKLMALSPEMYYPQPDVDSCVVTLKRRDGAKRVAELGAVLENCFSMRRKTIYNNLKAAYGEIPAREALLRAQIPEGARAEALEPEAFVRLAEALRA